MPTSTAHDTATKSVKEKRQHHHHHHHHGNGRHHRTNENDDVDDGKELTISTGKLRKIFQLAGARSSSNGAKNYLRNIRIPQLIRSLVYVMYGRAQFHGRKTIQSKDAVVAIRAVCNWNPIGVNALLHENSSGGSGTKRGGGGVRGHHRSNKQVEDEKTTV